MVEHTIAFDENGNARFIWSDDLVDLADVLGRTTVTRASHVEPYLGGWIADMRPSGGPVLGANGSSDRLRGTSDGRNLWIVGEEDDLPLAPFRTRGAALEAELAWLRDVKGL